MTKEEAKQILMVEKLIHYNWNEEHELRQNEIVIKFNPTNISVYSTDERASIISNSIFHFSSETDALDHFIKRVRTEKILY